MILNLGKKSIVFIIASANLFADVKTELYPKNIVRGTSAELVFTVTGSQISDPQISKIAGAKIDGVSTESFYQNINGRVNSGKKFRYRFSPDQSGKIESFKFKVDGVEEFSDEVVFSVVEPTFKGNEPHSIKLSSNKNNYYLGETIKVDITYREQDGSGVVERRYADPSGDNLAIKYKSVAREKHDENGSVIEMSLYLTPQQIGDLKLNGAKMGIAVKGRGRDNWGFMFDNVKWNEIASNSLSFNISQAPTLLVGDFDISASIDKQEINSGEAVNLILNIKGSGNIEDVQPLKLNVANGLVYDDKPEYNNSIANNGYLISSLNQKFAIVLETNSTIPSFKLEFFDPVSKQIKTKETKPFNIVVHEKQLFKNEQQIQNINISQNEPNNDHKFISNQDNLIYILIAYFSGVFSSAIIYFFASRNLSRLFYYFKLWRKDRELLQKIIPYVGFNDEVREIAEKLSKKINGDKSQKISFKEVKKMLNKLEKHENINS